jgi:putative protein-disulfide isomerase
MDMQKGPQRNNSAAPPPVKGVDMIMYTDPLCCWSWAIRPALERLKSDCGTGLSIRYKMGGLLPSWSHFTDETHSIDRPAQMGPEWMHAAHLSGVPICSDIWMTDPPSSSYPASIAVKCAELQSEDFVELFLFFLQRELMVHGRNIAKLGVLFDVAWMLHDEYDQFDLFQFKDDLLGKDGREAFRKDLQEVRFLGINRFPTMVIKRDDRSAVTLTGYQPYESLRAAIALKHHA